MGIYDKARTAQRTSAEVIPISLLSTWTAATQDALETFVIDAACQAGRGGTESSARRGRQNALIAAFAGVGASTCWFDVGPRHWQVSFGIASTAGRMHDWALVISPVESGVPGQLAVAVETSDMLTVDGKLANGSRYDETRRRLRDLSGVSQPASGPYEHDAVAHGLNAVPELINWSEEPPLAPVHTIATSLSVDEIADAFTTVPLPLMERGDGSWRWALSLLEPSATSTLRAQVDDNGIGRVVTLTTVSRPSGKRFVDDTVRHMMIQAAPTVSATIEYRDSAATVTKAQP
jgi:hypothetical protein